MLCSFCFNSCRELHFSSLCVGLRKDDRRKNLELRYKNIPIENRKDKKEMRAKKNRCPHLVFKTPSYAENDENGEMLVFSSRQKVYKKSKFFKSSGGDGEGDDDDGDDDEGDDDDEHEGDDIADFDEKSGNGKDDEYNPFEQEENGDA